MNGTICLRGGRPLIGEVTLAGAKNAVPKHMVASLLTEERCQLNNVPQIEDVEIMSRIIKLLGGTVELGEEKKLTITSPKISLPNTRKLLAFSGKSRIPVLLCGPLLARIGKAVLPMPGGCNIGPRPIDFHLKALEQLGAKITPRRDGYLLSASRLQGAKIRLDFPSVGATEQVILASVLAEGLTELSNAAIEPEIIDLVALLQKMGAIISVNAERVIRIRGVKKLHGFQHTAIPDRLEAASWACAAAATNGRIFVRNARQLDLITFLNKFRRVGGEFQVNEEGIEFYRGQERLSSLSVETDVHPGFMTDWQPPFVVLLTQAEGVSIVHETVYENRFGYVDALNKMGAKIQLYNECLGGRDCRFAQRNYQHSAAIFGPTPLSGAHITIPDLRAGFSYIIAAATARGESRIENFNTLERGYEKFLEKLISLGAQVTSCES